MHSVGFYYYGKQVQLQRRNLHFMILLLPSTWGILLLVDKTSFQMYLNNHSKFCPIHHFLWPWPHLHYLCCNLSDNAKYESTLGHFHIVMIRTPFNTDTYKNHVLFQKFLIKSYKILWSLTYFTSQFLL